jgi:CRISPR-associated protein Csm4
MDTARQQRRRRWIGLDPWRTRRIGLTNASLTAALATPKEPAEHRVPHNTIDRRSGHTPDTAGLWFADEWWPDRTALDIDLYVRGNRPASDVADLLRRIGGQGYGRDAALGRGLFEVEDFEEAGWLDDPPGTGGVLRWLSLSHGTITPNMRDARWRHTVIWGKLGRGMLAAAQRPWKLPVLLAMPGTTFAADNDGPFGAWLTGVHQDLPRIGHNAYHVAIPYTEATS